MLSVKNSLPKYEKHQNYFMDLVKHPEVSLILFGKSAIQPVCLFDVNICVPFHLFAKNLLYLRNVSVTKEAVK